MSEKLLKVGNYTPGSLYEDAKIDREFFGQGYIFKDEDAFLNHEDKVCYVPELSDAAYTRKDFLDECNGQKEFAEQCFYAVDWQHPTSWIMDQYANEEWGYCENCQKIYDMEGVTRPCPVCGAEPSDA